MKKERTAHLVYLKTTKIKDEVLALWSFLDYSVNKLKKTKDDIFIVYKNGDDVVPLFVYPTRKNRNLEWPTMLNEYNKIIAYVTLDETQEILKLIEWLKDLDIEKPVTLARPGDKVTSTKYYSQLQELVDRIIFSPDLTTPQIIQFDQAEKRLNKKTRNGIQRSMFPFFLLLDSLLTQGECDDTSKYRLEIKHFKLCIEQFVNKIHNEPFFTSTCGKITEGEKEYFNLVMHLVDKMYTNNKKVSEISRYIIKLKQQYEGELDV